MVEHQRILRRVPYIDDSIFQPFKLKLILESVVSVPTYDFHWGQIFLKIR